MPYYLSIYSSNQYLFDLIKSSSDIENTELSSSSSRAGASNSDNEDINVFKTQKPSSINQELKAYYTLNEDHIFSFEAQHLSQDEDPFYQAIKTIQPFRNILPLDRNQSNFDINQFRDVHTDKIEGKLDYYYILTPKSNLNLTFGITDVKQKFAFHREPL